jgi:hypothetical protein
MRSLSLTVPKDEFARALRVLAGRRSHRHISVWLSFDATAGTLTLRDQRDQVAASVEASGDWPAAGATVSLIRLRKVIPLAPTLVELHALDDAVLIPTERGHVTLPLIEYGPDLHRIESEPQLDLHSDLPLFSRARTVAEHYAEWLRTIRTMDMARDRLKRVRARRRAWRPRSGEHA